MKYVLLYTSADDVRTKAPAHLEAHVARLMEFHGRGELLQVGVFGDGTQGSMGIFASREGAEEFVREDPFALNGVVASHEIHDWDDVKLP